MMMSAKETRNAGIREPRGIPNVQDIRKFREVLRFEAHGRRLRCVATLAVLFFAATWVGCVGYPVPLSAQAGSTIAIPIAAGGGGSAVAPPIGYGGKAYTDYERGKMVYQLDGAGGFELDTRVTVAVTPHSSSAMAGSGSGNGSPPEIISIVDIPADAPEGTHSLYVIRRMPDGTEFPGPSYDPEIEILPHSIDLTDGETIVGAVTPSALANCSMNCGFSQFIDDVVPRPRIRLNLNGNGSTIGAFELDLSYPASVIDIVDAYEETNVNVTPINKTSTVWLQDDGAGLAHVSGVAHPDYTGSGVQRIVEVVFTLDNGNAPLDLVADPGAVQASLVAYDMDGNQISGAAATVVGIR